MRIEFDKERFANLSMAKKISRMDYVHQCEQIGNETEPSVYGNKKNIHRSIKEKALRCSKASYSDFPKAVNPFNKFEDTLYAGILGFLHSLIPLYNILFYKKYFSMFLLKVRINTKEEYRRVEKRGPRDRRFRTGYKWVDVDYKPYHVTRKDNPYWKLTRFEKDSFLIYKILFALPILWYLLSGILAVFISPVVAILLIFPILISFAISYSEASKKNIQGESFEYNYYLSRFMESELL